MREAGPSQYNLRLSVFFAITPGMWMNLQLDYEFMRTDREKGESIRKEVQPLRGVKLFLDGLTSLVTIALI